MSSHLDNVVRIDVLGPMRMVGPNGTVRTPKGAKNQALVAMLALSPGMARPRRWLEDKLWSSFGPEQASANLRQALSKVRTALGPHKEILGTDRSSVWLNESRVRIDLLEEVVPSDDRTELLEGLDARDPEFEDWLRQERAHLQEMVSRATPSDTKGVLITCAHDGSAPGRDQILAEELSNQVGENIAEQVRAWRQADPISIGAHNAPDSDVMIQTRIVDEDDGYALFIRAIHHPTARILFSKFERISSLQAITECDEVIGRTVFEAADRILGKLPHVLAKDRPETRATALSRLALYRMFSFDQDALREAYGLMEQAYRHDENSVYLAWSGFIRTAQMIERSEQDRTAMLEEAVDLTHRAMRNGTDNGLVQAIISKIHCTGLGDKSGVIDLARMAVERNPAGAFGWMALSDACMLIGDTENAFEYSAKACRLARSSPFKHFWDTGHCVVATAAGRPDEAIAAGEAAIRSAPLSRPAHRHLLALYAMKGEMEKSVAVAQKLAKIEPGFTLDRLVNDDSYPVRTLRNKGLLEPIRQLL